MDTLLTPWTAELFPKVTASLCALLYSEAAVRDGTVPKVASQFCRSPVSQNKHKQSTHISDMRFHHQLWKLLKHSQVQHHWLVKNILVPWPLIFARQSNKSLFLCQVYMHRSIFNIFYFGMQDIISLRVESPLTPLKFKVCKTTALSIMPSVLEMPFFFFFATGLLHCVQVVISKKISWKTYVKLDYSFFVVNSKYEWTHIDLACTFWHQSFSH